MNKADTEEKIPRVRTSRLAVTSLFLCLCAGCTNGFSAIIAVVLGVISLINIRKSHGRLRGRNIAVISIVISLVAIYFAYVPSARVASILKMGPFAKLPETAVEVRTEIMHPWFSFYNVQYLTFQATPEDIEIFLSQSPCLKDVDVEIFNPEHMHLPWSEVDNRDIRGSHEYYDPKTNPPYWDKLTIRERGRKYYISKGAGEGVEVIVNDETNTVYITVILG